MKMRFTIVGMISLLFLLSLACSRSGEILTPAEATARVEEARQQKLDSLTRVSGGTTTADFAESDTVRFSSTSFLVSLYENPGDTMAVAHVSRGSEGTIKGSEIFEGEAWYFVDTFAGDGWVPGGTLELVEKADAGSADAGSSDAGSSDAGSGDAGSAETGAVSEEAAGSAGPEIGDTVYLAGKSYLVSLTDEPGSKLIKATQERGAKVEILDIVVVDDSLWYFVQAPTGQGWISEENISVEKP